MLEIGYIAQNAFTCIKIFVSAPQWRVCFRRGSACLSEVRFISAFLKNLTFFWESTFEHNDLNDVFFPFFPPGDRNIWQLLNEPEYDMKNYAGRGCFPPRPNNLLRDQHKSSHYTKAEYNNCFITSWLEISTLAIESHDVSTSPRSSSPASKN